MAENRYSKSRKGVPSGPRISTSKRGRGGVRFQPVAEKRLVIEARSVLSGLDQSDGLLALTEFNAPFGVPDVTAVVGGRLAKTRRLRSRIPALLNEIDAGIVAAASPTIPHSTRQLAYYLRWPAGSVERRVPGLVATGALLETSGGLLAHPAIVPWGDLIAIELKLRDWRKALKQCRTYALWATSYVMVLEHVPPKALDELTSAVMADRGGLVVNGEVVVRPRSIRHRPARVLWATEHVVAELQTRLNRTTPSLR